MVPLQNMHQVVSHDPCQQIELFPPKQSEFFVKTNGNLAYSEFPSDSAGRHVWFVKKVFPEAGGVTNDQEERDQKEIQEVKEESHEGIWPNEPTDTANRKGGVSSTGGLKAWKI